MPSTGASGRTRNTSSVPATRAISGAGMNRASRPGVSQTIASETKPTMVASRAGALATLGSAASAPTVPPCATAWPNSGES